MDKELEKQIQQIVQKKLAEYEAENKTLKAQLSEEKVKQSVTLVKQVNSLPLPSGLKLDGNVRSNIEHFRRMWNNFETASGLQTETNVVRVSTMLTAIGEEASMKIYKLIEKPEDKTTEEILNILIEKLTPEVNIRYERYIYNSMKQTEEESYQDYFLKLKTQSKLCEYKTMEDELLLDKIICSIKDVKLREKLWLKKNIDLSEAINICKSSEETKKQLEFLEDKQNEINKVEFKNKKFRHTKNQKKCAYCGGEWHNKIEECPARTSICYQCDKKGHFATVCRQRRNNIKYVHHNVPNNDDVDQKILQVNHFKDQGVFINLNVILPNSKVKTTSFQLDTGATCSIIGEKTLCNILEVENIQLCLSNAVLRAVNGTTLGVKGKYTMKIRKGKHIFHLEFIVVDYDHKPLLSYKACDTLNLITYCREVLKICEIKNIQEKQLEKNIPHSTKKMVEKYKDVFEGIGEIAGEVDIDFSTEVTPVKQSPRRVPIALKDDLKMEIENMLKNNIIVEEPGYTDWTSNVTIVKRNNKLRVCIDPTHLNRAIKDTKQQLPTIDEIIPELNNAKLFSTMDATRGFWQVKLTERSSKLTAFWTPFGKYRYLRLPFGLSTAMEIFQKKMLEVVHGLRGVFVLADDILIVGYGDSQEDAQCDHDKNLEALLKRLKERNVKLNPDKTHLCKKEIKFYGHILTSQGIKPDPSKISSIVNMPRPENKEAVMRFLGMVTYLSRYINKLSDTTEVLRKITRNGETFQWTDNEEKAFLNIKNIIADATKLKYFDPKKPITIQADASSFALGCAILQEDQPVAYASKMLTSTQKNYAQIEKEMLAIVFACQRFDQYICGQPNVVIETDHSPLVSIFKKPLLKIPKRLQSMILTLQRYNLLVKYKNGTSMYLADTLSRAPESLQNIEKQNDIYKISQEIDLCETVSTLRIINTGINYYDNKIVKISDESIQRIKEETNTDGQLQHLKQQIIKGWPEEKHKLSNELKCFWNYRADLTIEDGIILKGNQILIPVKLRKEFLKKIHLGHLGIEATQKLAKEVVFWPNLNNEIKDLVQSCETCAKLSANQKRIEMKSYEVPKEPFEIISMDVFEVDIKGKKRRFLVTIDHYSDYFEIDELKDLSSACVILICKRNFSRHGIPRTVITDGATNFSSQEFKKFSNDWEFNHVMSSPHYPQSNGKAESAVKVVKTLIKKSIDSNTDFYQMLLLHRNTPNKTNFSPAKRLMNRWLRCHIPSINKDLEPIEQQCVQDKIKENKNKAKIYYDRHSVSRQDLEVDEDVWYKKMPESETWSKGKIESKDGNRSYTVRTSEGAMLRRNEKFIKPDSTHPETSSCENEERGDDVVESSPTEDKENVQNPPNQSPTIMSNDNEDERPTRQRRQTKLPSRYKDYVFY